MRKHLIAAAIGAITLMVTSCRETAVDPNLAHRVTPEEEYYIFQLSDNVTREHVYYKTRFGIELAGDLYTAKDLDKSTKHPAIVIGPPYGGVKEQGPGVYANQLAQRGFIVLTFDPAYHGYSGGEPRYTTSIANYSEDFCAGVDFLGTLEYVNREGIGAIGICGSGGFALSAASMDSRIKAVATSAMYDIGNSMNSIPGEMRQNMIKMCSEQRWKDIDTTAAPEAIITYPDHPLDSVPGDKQGLDVEWWTFYATKRGWHPNARGNTTFASMPDLMTFPGTTHIAEISPRPILFITGDIAHSKNFSEEAYAKASEPKELVVVEGAMHIDLYDNIELIPFDKIEDFFKKALE